ncbi:MAG: LysM peptidoglycan-binding domain-containing protein [Spirochaetes bacterium]|nr:LysM peptidoglycan-binding domain-containing protein [Spirochaetota bacterium]
MKNTESGYFGLLGLLISMFFFLFSLTLQAQETYQYSIKEGETLYSISRQFKVPLEAILKANGINDPSKVRVGTNLIIPNVYLVQKGDTLYGIARKMGVKVEVLLSLNNLQPQATIKPGDTLYVPKILEGKHAEVSQPANVTKEKATSSQPPEKIVKQRSEDPQQKKGVLGDPSGTGVSTVSSKESSPQVKNIYWPHPGTRKELTGKLEGISFQGKAGDPVYSVSSGKVAWVGPYRGFGKVVIIQSDQGYLYVYAGNETTNVEPGDLVEKGQRIGTLGVNPYNQTPDLYFLVYKDGKPVRPEEAPRI